MAEDGDTNLPPDARFDDTTHFNVVMQDDDRFEEIDTAISGEVDRRKSVKDIWGSASTRNFSGKSSKREVVIFDLKQSRGTVGRLQAVGESLGAGGGEAPGTGASTHRDAGKEDAESINRSDEGGKELAKGDLTAGRCRTRHVGRRRSSLRHWLHGRGC
ncbi:hypothetical protein BKA56DRAFT_615687 [Ilyonectria sp. MPI-CAGE-AT-0026]|nr:hypothetical protein BKA56DRAFT_615687 [Ilyonectria sp. MPI-CAGE-AT-0026]